MKTRVNNRVCKVESKNFSFFFKSKFFTLKLNFIEKMPNTQKYYSNRLPTIYDISFSN